jgi:hypothetical protein
MRAGILAVALLGAAAVPAHAAPAVTVLPRTTALDPAGQTLTVRGSGFDRNANGGVGIYVVFGPKGDDYSTNADRYQAAKWVRSSSLGGSGQGELRADGTFEVTLPDLKAKYTDANGVLVDCYAVTCLVMTFTAHGVPDRANDTFMPVAFATGKPAPVGRAKVPYRPSTTPSPRASVASLAATASTSPAPSRSTTPSAAAATVSPATPVVTPPAPVPPPVPLSQPPAPGAGGALAGVVVAGLGAGAAVTYGVRRRLVTR